MEKAKWTDFGLAVKGALLRQGKSQVWLENEVTRITGRYMDSSLMHKILTGKRPARKTVAVICQVLGLESEYHTGGPIKRTDTDGITGS